MQKVITFLAVTIFATSLPALAAGHSQNGHDEKCIKECQMLIKNCDQETDSIQQKISRFNQEIDKGNTAYTNEELRVLERKLQDVQQTLANLNHR